MAEINNPPQWAIDLFRNLEPIQPGQFIETFAIETLKQPRSAPSQHASHERDEMLDIIKFGAIIPIISVAT